MPDQEDELPDGWAAERRHSAKNVEDTGIRIPIVGGTEPAPATEDTTTPTCDQLNLASEIDVWQRENVKLPD